MAATMMTIESIKDGGNSHRPNGKRDMAAAITKIGSESWTGLGISHRAFVSARMRYVRGEGLEKDQCHSDEDKPGHGASH